MRVGSFGMHATNLFLRISGLSYFLVSSKASFLWEDIAKGEEGRFVPRLSDGLSPSNASDLVFYCDGAFVKGFNSAAIGCIL